MHEGELSTDTALVGRLLASQFPHWARLPIVPLASAGTDNALYRLGDDLVVRLPRIDWAVGQAEKERRWLPLLAPRLPLAIPEPLALGAADEGFPWPWSVHRWLTGENATIERLADPVAAATTLARFVTALRTMDSTGGPPPGAHNSWRGVHLATRDAETRAAIAACAGAIDVAAATIAWESALRASAYTGAPKWFHGDLHAGNLLAVRGHLSAVIDFGCLGVGDPACDLMVAWNLFSADARAAFRATLRVDDATWARGRGWALSVALIALPYYRHSNPVLAGIARHAIAEVLADRDVG